VARNRRAYKYSQTSPEAPAPPVWREMSATKRDKIRKATEQQIDEFMKRVGYANPAERTDENGGRWFNYGSAKGRAGIIESDSDGELFFRVESLVMELPPDENELLPLLRELLEANMTIAGPARMGISGESVFVCATVPLVELVPGDVPAHIHSVMTIAGKMIAPSDIINAADLLSSAGEELKET
jgi:hypothetical protein